MSCGRSRMHWEGRGPAWHLPNWTVLREKVPAGGQHVPVSLILLVLLIELVWNLDEVRILADGFAMMGCSPKMASMPKATGTVPSTPHACTPHPSLANHPRAHHSLFFAAAVSKCDQKQLEVAPLSTNHQPKVVQWYTRISIMKSTANMRGNNGNLNR